MANVVTWSSLQVCSDWAQSTFSPLFIGLNSTAGVFLQSLFIRPKQKLTSLASVKSWQTLAKANVAASWAGAPFNVIFPQIRPFSSRLCIHKFIHSFLWMSVGSVCSSLATSALLASTCVFASTLFSITHSTEFALHFESTQHNVPVGLKSTFCFVFV